MEQVQDSVPALRAGQERRSVSVGGAPLSPKGRFAEPAVLHGANAPGAYDRNSALSVIAPDAALPDDMCKDFPRLHGEIEAMRAACREFGDPDVVQREDLILEWVHEKMEEDGPAHTFMRMPEEFDDMLLAQLEGPLIRAFHCQSVLYSEPELFTTDNPFVLSGSADGEAILLAALTPHHLLVCSDEPFENEIEPLALLKPIPYLSFSTKILASAPMDLRLLWGCRLPLSVDPERALPKAKVGQRVEMEWRNIPVIRKA